ncbi:MAG: methyl-accepting chemotaxis protein [Pararhodobacter sp.]
MFQRLTQSRISLRLPALVVFALVLSIGASSWLYFTLFRSETRSQVETYARTVAEHARGNFVAWLDTMNMTLEDLAEGHLAPDGMRAFNEAFALQAPGILEDVRAAYVDRNPFARDERSGLDRGDSRPAYDTAHEALNRYFVEHRARFGYHDLFLISTDGAVLYSVAKQEDFGTRLDTGPFSGTGLAQVWQQAMEIPAGMNAGTDISLYPVAGGLPVAFVARRMIDTEAPGAPVIGVVALQLSPDAAQQALERAGDLSALDEIYLIAADGRARSAPRLEPVFDVLDTMPDLPQVRLAQSRESGYLVAVDGIHGRLVDASVLSFEARGAPFSVVVELDHDTAFSALTDFSRQAILFTGIGLLLSLVIGYLVARSITRPLTVFSGAMDRLAAEHYDDAVIGTGRHDEIGDLSRGLEQFREKLLLARDARDAQASAREEQEAVVGELGRGLRGLASGHLDIRLETTFSEGYEQLRADFNETVETMEGLMRAIAANATEIRARAEEISASSDDLSHRTENQAATLEETAAAMDELTASVRAAAESASEVERVVADARKEAEKSGQVVSEAVEAMSLIRKSSNEISQIIGVIDDIAFQTNLLALNAGVEAARAGDAGRGFAVVASEVRALAQRSSEAAKQIKGLITGSTEQVETGVGLVGRAGDTLGMIIERVGHIDQLVGGIASGAREQSSGLGEINVGVSQLDQVTQQNAAMVEQVTAAAMTLTNESKSLTQIVARFRIGAEAGGPGRSAQLLRVPQAGVDTPAFASAGCDKPPFDNEDQNPLSPMPEAPPLQIAANMARWQDF